MSCSLVSLFRHDSYNIKKIEKYSLATKSLEIVADMINDRREFCEFWGKVCFTGGNLRGKHITSSCI